MMEIFLIQLLAAGLGALSTASADWCYTKARIGARLHAFWVSASIAAICLPVLGWTSTIFLGVGLLGQSVAGVLVGAIFLWVYFNLPSSRPAHRTGPQAPQRPSSGAVPPASRLNG
ncbi:MAG: hypothetical protein JO320_10670 [Alphaproteobacteria bacterium]|nr:hypothetical protein [Alphaproteobacteria bacterium]MBV9375503.1 hypothetical protein [Alphaproteobacteria bacterium]MBV9815213.1 hypothetical protein [Alphaproteobacteria bacterium]